MKNIVLGIDTTTNICEVSLSIGDKRTDYISINDGFLHNERLIELINELLTRNKIVIKDVNCVAVNIGPGSFTGIRVGVSCARAIAQTLNIKIVPAQGLEISAYRVFYDLKNKENTVIISIMDALRNEVYASLYKCKENELEIIKDNFIIGEEDVYDLISKFIKEKKNMVITGNGINILKKINEYKKNVKIVKNKKDSYNKNMTARLGYEIFKSGKAKNYSEITPLYIRKPASDKD
jgi:tRNA threonylcarbamoyladenosine biosynthesis protein TsaB